MAMETRGLGQIALTREFSFAYDADFFLEENYAYDNVGILLRWSLNRAQAKWGSLSFGVCTVEI
jgi:hypothetical protein